MTVSQIFKDKEYMFSKPAFISDNICSIKDDIANLYYH